MDEEPVSAGQTVQVVDPDIRAHVYSLVTAVSWTYPPTRTDFLWPPIADPVTAGRVQRGKCRPICAR